MQPVSSATTATYCASAEEAIETYNKEPSTRKLGTRYGFKLYNGADNALCFSFSETNGWKIISRSSAYNNQKTDENLPTLKDAMPHFLKKPIKDNNLTNYFIEVWRGIEKEKSPCPLFEVAFSDSVSSHLNPQLPLPKLPLELVKTVKDTVANAKEAFALQKEFRHIAKVIVVDSEKLPFPLESRPETEELYLREYPNSCLVFTEPSEKVARFMLHMIQQYSHQSRNWASGTMNTPGDHLTGISTIPVSDAVDVYHFTQSGYLTQNVKKINNWFVVETSLMGAIFFKDNPENAFTENTKDIVINEFNKWAAIQSSVLIQETILRIFNGQSPLVELISDYAMPC